MLITRPSPALLVMFFLLPKPMLAAEGDDIDFRRDVAPILADRCVRCHKPGNEKGDLSLATAAGVKELGYIVPGKPDESYLLEVVVPEESGRRPRMPKEGDPLSDAQVALLRRWIAAGAPWPDDAVVRDKTAADRTWWSLQPLAHVEPPSPAGIPTEWADHPIDRFVYARLQEKGLEPSEPADRRTLIRRLSYDLIGLPPSPEEVEAFVADSSPRAYEKLVDRLLASPHYGQQWGRHWLDVVRFGESNGFERNVIIDNLWPFRDYVIRSFNEDKPFDRFIREHLAGDVLGRGDPRVEVGTAFLVCGPYDNVGNQDPVQAAVIRANTIDEMIRAAGEAFLGMTVGCARCHDHKFDPIRQEDYYALYATLAGVRHGERQVATPEQRQARSARIEPLERERNKLLERREQLEATVRARADQQADTIAAEWTRPPTDRYGTQETFGPIRAKYVRLVVEALDSNPDVRAGYHIDEFEVWTSGHEPRNVALAARGGKAEGASRVAKDFSDAYSAKLTIDGRFGARWIAAGPELTITLAEPHRIDRIVFSSDRKGSLDRGHYKTTFVGEYRLLVSLDGKTWTEVADSYDRKPASDALRSKRLYDRVITESERQKIATLNAEIGEIDARIRAVPELPTWWLGRFEPAPGRQHVFLGGDPQRHGVEVTAASPSMLSDVTEAYTLPADAPEAKRRLALARWITADENPLTPRVLVNRVWQWHFGTGLVETPSDFGAMGGRPSHPLLLDWLARQLHRHDWRLKPLHKLIVTSQTYRQATTWNENAGQIDSQTRLLWRFPPRRLTAEEIRDTMLRVAGKLDTRMGGPGFRLYEYLQDNVATYVPLDEVGAETYRRAVYHQNARAAPVDVLADFDCPDPAFPAPRRSSTITPLQALTLLNHDFALDMARFWAERLQRELPQAHNKGRIRRAFQQAFAREPSEAELKAALMLAGRHGLRAFCRAMLNTGELIYLE